MLTKGRVLVGISARPVLPRSVRGVEAVPGFPGLREAIAVRVWIAGVGLPGSPTLVPRPRIDRSVPVQVLPLPGLSHATRLPAGSPTPLRVVGPALD